MEGCKQSRRKLKKKSAEVPNKGKERIGEKDNKIGCMIGGYCNVEKSK